MTTTQENCIFCKIAAGQAKADIVYQDELVTAFRDIHPVTPVHILIVPNQHLTSMDHITAVEEGLVGHLATVASRLAAQEGIQYSGYRLVINTGPDAGQSVFHLHMHLIGGRRMPFRFE